MEKTKPIDLDELKLDLVKQNHNLTKQMISELKRLNSWSVGLGESLLRKKISQYEKILDSLEEEFFDYNENVGRYIGFATTLKGKGATLNLRIGLGIICSQLSDERNAVMSLLNSIRQNLNDKRNTANNLLPLLISIIAVIIAIIALIFR